MYANIAQETPLQPLYFHIGAQQATLHICSMALNIKLISIFSVQGAFISIVDAVKMYLPLPLTTIGDNN